MSLKYSVIRPPQVMLAQFKMNLQGLSRFRSQSSLCFDVLQPHRSMQMRVLFFREDGSEQMSRQYTSPGRWYYDQDYAYTDHVYTEGDVIKFHMGHSVWREYTVVASDGKTAFVQPRR